LLSFSALLVCILPHCRLREWCGNLRKASGHVVCRLNQSASFRIFDSTFYFPHSAIPHFTHSLLEIVSCGSLWHPAVIGLDVPSRTYALPLFTNARTAQWVSDSRECRAGLGFRQPQVLLGNNYRIMRTRCDETLHHAHRTTSRHERWVTGRFAPSSQLQLQLQLIG